MHIKQCQFCGMLNTMDEFFNLIKHNYKKDDPAYYELYHKHDTYSLDDLYDKDGNCIKGSDKVMWRCGACLADLGATVEGNELTFLI